MTPSCRTLRLTGQFRDEVFDFNQLYMYLLIVVLEVSLSILGKTEIPVFGRGGNMSKDHQKGWLKGKFCRGVQSGGGGGGKLKEYPKGCLKGYLIKMAAQIRPTPSPCRFLIKSLTGKKVKTQVCPPSRSESLSPSGRRVAHSLFAWLCGKLTKPWKMGLCDAASCSSIVGLMRWPKISMWRG